MNRARQHQQVVEWNDSRRHHSGPRLLHRLFEATAAESPDAVAVVSDGDHLTYGELDRQAGMLARYLEALGVGPESAVGLCLEGGLELTLGALAILKAGGVYVPLDPAYPARRLRFMLRDTGASVLLTRCRQARRLGALQAEVGDLGWSRSGQVKAVCLDAGWQGAVLSESPVTCPVSRDNIAYVIYTSGSTGRPKGVAVSHRAVVNRLRWSQDALPLSATDRVLQQASASFDFSIWELFATWMAGATVVLVPADRRRDAGGLATQARDDGVTVAHFVPALLVDFLAVGGSRASGATAAAERLGRLRLLLSGGEALTARLRDRALSQLDAELVNQYGPTEAAIDATFQPCRRGDSRSEVPIGRPIANTRIHLLDGGLEPVPAGATGEIHIAGVALARGYLGRAGRTAASFIPDPLSGDPGSRLYRTGDLARHLDDGAIDFAGRRDHQVKVRGLRIELGEVEAVLERHPDVGRAVALVDDSAGGPRLVAWVVPEEPRGRAESVELRHWLRQRLPATMIPAVFLTLDTLPTTPAGKIDRVSLARRAARLPSRGAAASFTAPRSPQEEILAEIWSEVLGVAPIGVHDHFLELGGHSLAAGRVLSRIRRIFRVELPVAVLFEHPTIAALVPVLTPSRETPSPVAPPIEPGARPERHSGGGLPLSFAQERLWFLDRLVPSSSAYNLPSALRLTGRLDAGALERSLRRIVRRHEVLRTRFPSTGGKPHQEISPRPGLNLAIVDLGRLRSSHRWAVARMLAAAEALRPFDLARGPLLRTTLLRLAAAEHVLLLNLHHIVSDGWSRGILYRELAAFYDACSDGAPAALPELTIQVADVALWQRRWLRGEALATRLEYWRRQLGDRPAVLELPADRPRPPRPSRRGVSHRWALGRPLTAALEELGIAAGASLYMTLLAAFTALLNRLTQQREILIGVPVAGRHSEATEDLIGLFVNTLVMRGTLGDGLSFAGHLDRTRATALGAYAHQDLPFEKLVEELQPERDPSRNPLFQATLVLHNAPAPEPRLAGLEVRPFDAGAGEPARFDLSLYLRRVGAGLEGTMVGARDLFDRATVARFCGCYQSLLRAAVADPDRPIAALRVIDRAQRHQLLVEWANRPRDSALPGEDRQGDCLHHLFEAQVARAPEAIALAFEDQRLSYRWLDYRADRLARAICRASGPEGTDKIVAICLERSPEMVAAVLAVLKAGRAYLFLDPAHPRIRRLQLLADARAGLVLTSRALAPDFDDWPGEVLRLDDGETLAEPAAPPDYVSPRHAAYVTYTSGSTGRAKGVIASHQAAVSYLRFIVESYALGPADVALQLAPLTFDRSVRDLFAPLAAGATVVLSAAGGNEPERILREIADQRVTCLSAMVPTALRQLDASTGPARPATCVRWALFAGERFTWADRQRAAALFGTQVRLSNLYGPTEGTCTASAYLLPARDTGATVAIGRPHPHVSIYLLDRALRPIPAGAAGELTLTGAGLARGYLGRPSATARAFVPSTFGEPGGRLYRTGDLGRHRGDGQLELLGRIDHQLKIRGFRIEPGEVEAALAVHPAVRAAVVASHGDAAGDPRLVAYLLLAPDSESSNAGTLRRFLRRTLPDHLVPSVFVPLGTLPLTAGGKVDRGALARRAVTVAPAAEVTAPRDPVEEILTGIWSELLGVERIGVDDHFFELGGHSLLATRLVARIRRLFGVELPLKRLFEQPTVAGLARAIARARPGDGPPPAPPLKAGPRPPEVPLSFGQERLWFLDRLEPGSPAYNMASAWRLTGVLDAGALDRSLSEIWRRHQVLRSRFPAFDGEPRQVFAPRSGSFRLPIVDLAGLAPWQRRRESRRLAAAEAAQPFDLNRGPVLRTTLIRLEGERHVLLLTAHHIASDAWSYGNLYRELAILYRAATMPMRASGATLPGDASSATANHQRQLPELPVQYADYALWQRVWLRGEALDARLAYWRRQLGDGLEPLRLPADRPRSAVRSDRGGVVALAFAGEETAALRALSSAAGATLFMSLLAAFATVLSRYSGQQDVIVGSPIANRGQAELEPLIGMFANTVVLRVDLASGDGGPLSFRGLLERVRQVALDAYAYQDTPFERLVDALRPARGPGSSPLFQVMFAPQNAPVGRLELAGLEVARIESAPSAAKFDLSLSLRESPSEGRPLEGELVYKADLFDVTRVRRLARHLKTLLDGAVRAPDRPLAQLSLLCATERQQLVVEWNDTRIERAGRDCLHQLFERQTARTPDRIALVFEDRCLSYRQLDERANDLAGELAGNGVGRGDVVPVLMQPGLEVPVALLAVMKSGAAYAPLDIRWPRQRTAAILDDLDARIVLVNNARGARLAEAQPGALALDVSLALSTEDAPVPDPPVRLQDPIYAIYTSGSTGKPKAAVNTHGGIVNRLLWMDRQYGRDRDRVVLQTTHHVYDSSVWQMFWSLLYGGRSVLPATGQGYDLDALIDVIDEQKVTFTDFVPSVFDLLVDRLELRPAQLRRIAGLRQVIVGGEAIKARAIHRFRRRLPTVGFSNLYGPTETAIGVTCYRIPERPREPIPIGRPIDNVTVLILDGSLAPVPVGVPGEIHLGGACVGLGYLHDPERSARVFVDSPFDDVPGKLYKTGDLARYRADGNIEFLGRVDDQIKIRGFRVEPVEIECVLVRHPSIREAVVVARQASREGATAGDLRLVAYVVPQHGADRPAAGGAGGAATPENISAMELHAFMERRLPRHMMPAELVALEALPVTPGGKVDRKALARSTPPAGRPLNMGSLGVAPRTEVERDLAAIWSEVLDLGRPSEGRPAILSVDRDFFDLGGHSLLAVRLMTRIEHRFQVKLPLSALFERPTIAGLAELVTAGGGEQTASPLVPIRIAAAPHDGPLPGGRGRPPFFCVHPVGGQVLCYRELAHHLDAEQPFYGLRAWGSSVGEALDPTIEAMAARYARAIRDLQPQGPYRLGGWSMGGVVAFEIAHRLCTQGEAIDALVLIDTTAPGGDAGAQPCDAGAQPCAAGAQPCAPTQLGRTRGTVARDLGLSENPGSLAEQLAELGLEDGLGLILENARRAGILPADVDLGRVRDLYRLFENGLRALKSYVPLVYPGRFTLLRSSQRRVDRGPALGWSRLAGGGVEVHLVPGDHFTMLREPYVRVLAERLEACLGTSRRQRIWARAEAVSTASADRR